MITPNHAIFRQIFIECLQETKHTFDYLPASNTPYPFVYIGENSSVNTINFDVYGDTDITIHIYGLRSDRTAIDDLTVDILSRISQITTAFGYFFTFKTCSQQDALDTTDVQPLIHRVLDVNFTYTRKDIIENGSRIN